MLPVRPRSTRSARRRRYQSRRGHVIWLSIDIRIERDGAGYLPPRRSLGARIHGYAVAMFGLAKVIVGAIAGLVVAAAIVLIEMIVRL